MITKRLIFSLLLTACLTAITDASAQETKSINWITFEQLDDSLAKKPKKVFIDFYTDWCTYCRKMDKLVFTKPQIVALINEKYYAIRFDAETSEEVEFGGQTFVNSQIGKSRSPIHQIAQLLASRQDKFSPPTMLVLDKNFNVTARYFEYMDSKKLEKALR